MTRQRLLSELADWKSFKSYTDIDAFIEWSPCADLVKTTTVKMHFQIPFLVTP